MCSPQVAAAQRRGGRCAALLAVGAVEGELVLYVVGGDGAGVEFGCVVEADPFEHLVMVFVVGVGEDLF
jgi:hypothetical protein